MMDGVRSLVAGFGGVAGLVAIIGLVIKLWPNAVTSFATWIYAHVDPERLPYGSATNRHWAQQREIIETQHRMQDAITEIRRDTIKNTILQLIRDAGNDHRREVAYELSKLEALESHCWVMDVARDYIGGERSRTNR